jgi:DNA-binding protein H-NS
MARTSDLSKMSYVELLDMEKEIQRLKAGKQAEERAAAKAKLTAEAKKLGFDIITLFGKQRGGGSKRGVKVAIKFRDPNDSSNTWTGRGRMPRWLATATKNGKASKDDFLVK